RAARRAGRFDEAREHLRHCPQTPGGHADAVVLEWALLRAAMGDVDENEEFLREHARQEPALAPLVWEALAEGDLQMYRVRDALVVLGDWLDVRPDDPQALFLRGNTYRSGGAYGKAADDYRRVTELDPDRDDARLGLVPCLIQTGRYSEALDQVRRLLRRHPDDVDRQV